MTLASASPRRLALLAQIGVVPDRVRAPEIDEAPRKDELPRPYAMRMSAEKAAATAEVGVFTLAADTVVAVGRRILPKARDAAEVRDCLGLLSGRRHHVITSVTLVSPGGQVSGRVVDSAVVLTRLSHEQVEQYVACDEGLGKAGGYAIQGRAAAFIRLLTGSYSGVVGLPLFETAALLRGRGYPMP